MKRIFLMMSLVALVTAAMAVPAKRGMWQTITLADGTQVKALLVGDEHGHYWHGDDGVAYIRAKGADYYVTVDAQQVASKAKARRAKVNEKRIQKRVFGHPTTILGQKKAIIILANFSDTKFNKSNNKNLYQRIANEQNFSEGKFKGSMADYFKAQSHGKFELEFDVVGPVTLSKRVSYYGVNDSEGNDMHAGEMVAEAVSLAKASVSDWKQYDWDSDGFVDQVYVVYAGKGEADGGEETTIWPHAYDLGTASYYEDGSGPVLVGTNLYVDSYACGPELDGQTGTIGGIGVMCHEFSHCLGYPDFYDIDYGKSQNGRSGQGMGAWDLMDQGSYNGGGFQPAGYTSYERWFAGWETPIELKEDSVEVENMKSLQNGGEFYIIYNDKNKNEFYMLENRQMEGWDASLPSAGLLILHCDYDATVWEENGPNDDYAHQRMTVVSANGRYNYETFDGARYYDDAELFPYSTVASFNKNFKTYDAQARNAAQFFTKTSNGTYWMNGSVENIRQNSDNTISFDYIYTVDDTDPVVTPAPEGMLFYESFDQCAGKGGNDGAWSDQVANGTFLPDNEGWEAYDDKAYGADRCAKFGTGKVPGSVTSPAFTLNGTTTLTFKAGAWNAPADQTALDVTISGMEAPYQVQMEKGAFTDYKLEITGTGSVQITFASVKGRFFLDEVVVVDPITSAINEVSVGVKTDKVFDLQGRRVDAFRSGKGIYIINGRKVVR